MKATTLIFILIILVSCSSDKSKEEIRSKNIQLFDEISTSSGITFQNTLEESLKRIWYNFTEHLMYYLPSQIREYKFRLEGNNKSYTPITSSESRIFMRYDTKDMQEIKLATGKGIVVGSNQSKFKLLKY